MTNVSFDNFYCFNSKTRRKFINDPVVIKHMLKQNVVEHRYLHSLSVAEVCVSLALKHNVDTNKAYMAGLLHDCCKFSCDNANDILEEYLNYYEPKKINGNFAVYHSWVAKYYLKEKLNFHDSDILNAIYNHTICNSHDKLSLILFIADKREPLRKINDNILELAYNDLYSAFDLLQNDIKEYLLKNGKQFIENSI